MSPLEVPPPGRSRWRITSYGVVIGAAVFALAVLVVMNRFRAHLDDSLDLVERQYEEALQYTTLARHIQSYAQESAELLARPGELVERDRHAEAARRIFAVLS